MNLYLISQTVNNDWNTYDSAVVCAEDEEDAKMIHPASWRSYTRKEDGEPDTKENWDGKSDPEKEWCEARHVKAKFIGTSAEGIKRGVVCASYNAA